MTKKNFKELVGLSSTLKQLFIISLSILNELDENQNVWNLGSKEISILSIDNKSRNNIKSICNKLRDSELIKDKSDTKENNRAILKYLISITEEILDLI